MFSVEVKFKVNGRELTLQSFAELFLLEGLRSAQQQLQLKNIGLSTPVPQLPREAFENRAPKPKVVSITEAARLVSLRPSTIRSYVATRRITFVRIGRRVLIPKEGIEDLIRRGLHVASERSSS
jgi:excisionase family DNA binding protein